MPNAPKDKRRRPTVSVIGAGRLGAALALALSRSGYEVEAVVARRAARAKKAATMLGRRTRPLSATQLDSLPLSRVLIISTPDDHILETATVIAKLPENPARGRTVLHTSGALSSADVLAPLAEKGFHTGSLHPLVSVSEPLTGADKLIGASYCVEGDAAASRVARSIVHGLQGSSFHIASKYKPLYHAAAVTASGHMVALFSVATDMLTRAGLDQKTARRVLLSLLKSTVANLSASDPTNALTGTFARGDLDTVKRHLRALSGTEFTEALAAYKLLGRRSLELAKGTVDPNLRAQILRELD